MTSSASTKNADATTIYNYHRIIQPLLPADAIFCLCSLDTRVAHYAAKLFLDGLAPLLIFSGGSGVLTRDRFDKPEAEVFADIAVEAGVPRSQVLIESESTNTGENVRFTYALLQKRVEEEEEERGHVMLLMPKRLLLVQKPYMLRRTYATFRKQWPDDTTEFSVSGPDLAWEEYPDEGNPEELVINIMVGDLVRIKEYPAKGYQIHQDIDAETWRAGQRLIAAGFDKHLP